MLTKEELLRLKDSCEAEKTKKVQLETKQETLVEDIKTKYNVANSKELLAKMEDSKKELLTLNTEIETKTTEFREKWDV